MKRFALAGNPNCGKTTLFNSLTGSSAHVGNWPGVTVEKKDGTYKKLKEPISIIDLPGIYSLSPYTSEEVIARNYIIDEKPDCVINIVDATNLERNLYLTTQLLEIDVPMVVAINMMDILNKRGDVLDLEVLQEKLGIPCVEVSALKEDHLDELMKAAYEASKQPRIGRSVFLNKDLVHLIGDVKIAFEGKGVDNPLFHAIKLIENDEVEVKMHGDLVKMVDEFKKTFNDDVFGDDIEAVIADSRYKYITAEFAKALTRNRRSDDDEVISTQSDRIDRFLTHKVFGLVFFAVVLFLAFHLTFSENLFFLGGLFKNVVPSFEGSIYEGLFWSESGINSPGVIMFNFFDMSFSALTDAARGGLDAALGVGHWFTGFLCDGVLTGLFAILGFLPQILLLFLFFSIMEDTGYMARVAFIFDKLFRKFGLSGRALIPMIMGFGCSVPAMINTRTLADDKEKIATVRVIPFFSCGAKLPILLGIAGAIAEVFGFSNVDLITYSMYVLGICTAVIAVLIMRNTTLKGDSNPFIMELPAYHLPQFKALMIHLWDKAKHFVKKAFTIILASTIIVWFLTNFGWNWHMVDSVGDSILGSIGQLIQPIFTPLGFGSQLSPIGWVFAVAAITGLIAKENVIATFISLGTVAVAFLNSGVVDPSVIEAIEADENGITATVAMIHATGITWQGCISFIAFNMLTIPCFAACATARAELPKGKFKWTLLFWILTSFIGSAFVYCFLSMFSRATLAWAIPVTVGLILLGVCGGFCIHFYNKRQRTRKLGA
ncbi:MAG: ferrous iron transport protein B [Bacilli bacterium]|nr:ferrous iron transport protein B [Bacilli bacterium]